MKTKLFFRVLATILVVLLLIPGQSLPALAQPESAQTTSVFDESMGKIGGAVTAITLRSNYAFIGYGAEVLIFDTTKVGSSDPPEDYIHSTGLLPGSVQSIALAGDYAYIAAGNGLVIFDISITTEPIKVAMLYSADGFNYVTVANNYAYAISGNNCMQIFDVSNPYGPKLLSKRFFSGTVMNLAIRENNAFIADGDFHVFNIYFKTAPVEIAAIPLDGQDYSVIVDGIYAYVLDTLNGITVINIAKPISPAVVGSLDRNWKAQSMIKKGYDLLVSLGENGLDIVDVTDPSNPIYESTYHPDGTTVMAAYRTNIAYTASETIGLCVFDLSSPPDTVTYHYLPFDQVGNILDMTSFGDTIYSARAYNGLGIIDITDPLTLPVSAGHYPTPLTFSERPANCAAADGADAFLGEDQGLRIVDVSDPGKPTEAADLSLGFNVSHIAQQGNTLFLVDALNGTLHSVDVADKNSPKLIVESISGFTQPKDLLVSGDYAYIADTAGLHIVDISDVSSLSIVGSYPVSGLSGEIARGDNILYLAAEEKLILVNVSEPTAPILHAEVVTSPYTYSNITISDQMAFLNGSGRVDVYDLSDPLDLQKLASAPFPGEGGPMVVHGESVYVGTFEAGLVYIPNVLTPRVPGIFTKTGPAFKTEAAPVDDNMQTSITWSMSEGAQSYQYCVDRTNDYACQDWKNAGNSLSILLDVDWYTTYYWQVRAVNETGVTYANNSESDYWNFQTQAEPYLPPEAQIFLPVTWR